LFFEIFFNDKYRPAQFGLVVGDALSANQQWLERFDSIFKIKPQWLELSRFEKCQDKFDAGRYQRAIALLEVFLKDYKGSAWAFDRDTLLLAGQCYVQLGKTEKAYDTFLQLIFEYPDSRQADEASLILGYTYMINNEFDLARDIFNALIKTSIKSQYISRANQYLERINLLTQ
jgi:outer membrane protein assembly factor BamD (BamD/ComL family)